MYLKIDRHFEVDINFFQIHIYSLYFQKHMRKNKKYVEYECHTNKSPPLLPDFKLSTQETQYNLWFHLFF